MGASGRPGAASSSTSRGGNHTMSLNDRILSLLRSQPAFPNAGVSHLPSVPVKRSDQAARIDQNLHIIRSHSEHATAPLLSSAFRSSRRDYFTMDRTVSDNTTIDTTQKRKRMSLMPSMSPPIKGRASLTDDDALRLAELGYDQAMTRKFSVWSILGVGFSLTNSWFGLSAAMVTGINSGGTALIMYGVIIIAMISTYIAISLSELASALPSAGGQYYWAHELAPKKYRDFASFFVGWFSWAGAIFTSASVALSLSFAIIGCYQLSHPD